MASTVARMCGGHRRTCERLKFFAVLTLKKKVTKLTKEIRSWPQGIRTGYKITELPIEPQGSWRVKLIKKAIRLWYVSFFVLCCRCAFFAMSMFERASLLLFSVLTREFVLFQEIVLLYMAMFREGWLNLLEEDIHKLSCWSLSQRECPWNFAVASKQCRTKTNRWKSEYITNLGTRNYRVLHLAYNPRPFGLGLYARFVKPDKSSA